MGRPYDPPLAYVGMLASQADEVQHAFHAVDEASFCGLDPRWRRWHTSDVATRPTVRSFGKLCSACADAILEQAVVRTLNRIGGKGTLRQILDDVPEPCPAKPLQRAVARLVGRHVLMAYILPGDYPNLVEYRMPER